MEIPTKNLDERLDKLAERLSVSQHPSRIKTVLDAREVIKAQALEIRELQAVIVRLREEASAVTESRPVDFWAKRRMAAFRALSNPRIAWEDFKRKWTDD